MGLKNNWFGLSFGTGSIFYIGYKIGIGSNNFCFGSIFAVHQFDFFYPFNFWQFWPYNTAIKSWTGAKALTESIMFKTQLESLFYTDYIFVVVSMFGVIKLNLSGY